MFSDLMVLGSPLDYCKTIQVSGVKIRRKRIRRAAS